MKTLIGKKVVFKGDEAEIIGICPQNVCEIQLDANRRRDYIATYKVAVDKLSFVEPICILYCNFCGKKNLLYHLSENYIGKRCSMCWGVFKFVYDYQMEEIV